MCLYRHIDALSLCHGTLNLILRPKSFTLWHINSQKKCAYCTPPSAQFPWDFASSWGRRIIIYIHKWLICIYHNIFTPQREDFKFHFQTMGCFEGQSERWHIKDPMFLFGAKWQNFPIPFCLLGKCGLQKWVESENLKLKFTPRDSKKILFHLTLS